MAVHEMTTDTFNSTVKSNDLVLVDFGAEWCPPCRAFEPIFDKVSQKYPDVFFGRVDIDKNQQLAAAYSAFTIPMLMVIKDKQIIYQQPGGLRPTELNDLIKRAKELDMSTVVTDRVEAQTRANAPEITEP
jgi:thioredoxin